MGAVYLPNKAVPRVKKELKHWKSIGEEEDHEEYERSAARIEAIARHSESPIDRIYRVLKPVAYLAILPLFSFANAGIEISSETVGVAVSSPVFYGVIAGLVLGKPIGIAFGAWLSRRFKWGNLTEGVTLRHVIVCGMLGGIGFTVSLFITSLAFGDGGELRQPARLGVLAASIGSAALAGIFIKTALGPPSKEEKGGK